ncbi:MAG: hypothetical protein EAZ61_09830 [Oscillatoriales cyanobacterium]|nr:MAG: hypothetical protein EAZ61_09830 [Oscillatoriales cyanobacterium]
MNRFGNLGLFYYMIDGPGVIRSGGEAAARRVFRRSILRGIRVVSGARKRRFRLERRLRFVGWLKGNPVGMESTLEMGRDAGYHHPFRHNEMKPGFALAIATDRPIR